MSKKLKKTCDYNYIRMSISRFSCQHKQKIKNHVLYVTHNHFNKQYYATGADVHKMSSKYFFKN